MKHLRRQLVLLACWLVGLFSVEQLLEPFHFSRATYIFIFTIMIAVLVTPRFTRVSVWALFIAPISVFLLSRTGLIQLPVMSPSCSQLQK